MIDHGIPGETLTPCPISDRSVESVKALAALAAEYRGAAVCANGKIKAIAEILEGEVDNEGAER